MPRLNGLALLERIRAHDLDIPVVLITGSPSLETAIAAVEHGALRYLTKPVDGKNLRAVTADAVRLHRLARAKRSALDLAGGRGPPRWATARASIASLRNALRTLWMAYQADRHPGRAPRCSATKPSSARARRRCRIRPRSSTPPSASTRPARPRTRQLPRRRSEPVAGAARGRRSSSSTCTPTTCSTRTSSTRRSPIARTATRVVLEITERASLHPIRDVRARIARLRGMGFRIAIDDLGAGYAGLTSFAQLEPEVVKLDIKRRFVRRRARTADEADARTHDDLHVPRARHASGRRGHRDARGKSAIAEAGATPAAGVPLRQARTRFPSGDEPGLTAGPPTRTSASRDRNSPRPPGGRAPARRLRGRTRAGRRGAPARPRGPFR